VPSRSITISGNWVNGVLCGECTVSLPGHPDGVEVVVGEDGKTVFPLSSSISSPRDPDLLEKVAVVVRLVGTADLAPVRVPASQRPRTITTPFGKKLRSSPTTDREVERVVAETASLQRLQLEKLDAVLRTPVGPGVSARLAEIKKQQEVLEKVQQGRLERLQREINNNDADSEEEYRFTPPDRAVSIRSLMKKNSRRLLEFQTPSPRPSSPVTAANPGGVMVVVVSPKAAEKEAALAAAADPAVAAEEAATKKPASSPPPPPSAFPFVFLLASEDKKGRGATATAAAAAAASSSHHPHHPHHHHHQLVAGSAGGKVDLEVGPGGARTTYSFSDAAVCPAEPVAAALSGRGMRAALAEFVKGTRDACVVHAGPPFGAGPALLLGGSDEPSGGKPGAPPAGLAVAALSHIFSELAARQRLAQAAGEPAGPEPRVTVTVLEDRAGAIFDRLKAPLREDAPLRMRVGPGGGVVFDRLNRLHVENLKEAVTCLQQALRGVTQQPAAKHGSSVICQITVTEPHAASAAKRLSLISLAPAQDLADVEGLFALLRAAATGAEPQASAVTKTYASVAKVVVDSMARSAPPAILCTVPAQGANVPQAVLEAFLDAAQRLTTVRFTSPASGGGGVGVGGGLGTGASTTPVRKVKAMASSPARAMSPAAIAKARVASSSKRTPLKQTPQKRPKREEGVVAVAVSAAAASSAPSAAAAPAEEEREEVEVEVVVVADVKEPEAVVEPASSSSSASTVSSVNKRGIKQQPVIHPLMAAALARTKRQSFSPPPLSSSSTAPNSPQATSTAHTILANASATGENDHTLANDIILGKPSVGYPKANTMIVVNLA
jgi:hypothetical protein